MQDFAATPADVPKYSTIASVHSEHQAPQTAEQIATGRKLGAEIEAELVKRISGMGMPAEHAVKATKPQINDLVIRGYLISFNKGSAAERIAIGFGAGASDLKVAAEGFQAPGVVVSYAPSAEIQTGKPFAAAQLHFLDRARDQEPVTVVGIDRSPPEAPSSPARRRAARREGHR